MQNDHMLCCHAQVSQGKSTAAASPSPKKATSPLVKKTSSAAAEAVDTLAGSSSSVRAAAGPGGGVGGKPKATGGPKIYTCYMCGQGFSGSSLGLHQPKCQQKWLAEQAAKPPGEFELSVTHLWVKVGHCWEMSTEGACKTGC